MYESTTDEFRRHTDVATGTWLALLAGAGMLIGAFLPWISVTVQQQDANGYPYAVSSSVSGVSAYLFNSWYVVMLGGALALIEVVVLLRASDAGKAQGLLEVVLAAVVLGIAATTIATLSAANAAVHSSGLSAFLQGYNGTDIQVGPGGGLWLVAVAAAGAALAGLWRLAGDEVTLLPARAADTVVPRAADTVVPVADMVAPVADTAVTPHPPVAAQRRGAVATYWMIGDKGTILRTSDGGQTWEIWTPYPANYALNRVVPVDGRAGWAVGARGVILRTTDGGQTWSTQQSGTRRDLYGVATIDARTAWAVGGHGTIVQTSDGGATWTGQTSGITNPLHDAAFVDARTGWIVGDSGAILHTSDGGTTWTVQPSDCESDLRGISFINANAGWAVGSYGAILHTVDGGASWRRQRSGTDQHLHGVAFDGVRGWAVGGSGTILQTVDGGATWSAIACDTTDSFTAVTFTDAKHGWIVGAGGTCLRTSDGGATWTRQRVGAGGGPSSPSHQGWSLPGHPPA